MGEETRNNRMRNMRTIEKEVECCKIEDGLFCEELLEE